MKFILAVASVVCLWHKVSCEDRHFKKTHNTQNPSTVTVTEHVYFDVRINNYYKAKEHLEGRFVVAVFGDALPMTALNFVSLARGYKRGKELLTYNNTLVHRIVPDFVIQMGDVNYKRGNGGTSIYGDTFRDEAFVISHASAGIVSMANKGKDTNNSQFFVTLQTARYLDGHHVAFGKIIAGMDFIRQISELKVLQTGEPVKKTTVLDCGVEGIYSKYEMTAEQLETASDDFRPEDFFQEKSADEEDLLLKMGEISSHPNYEPTKFIIIPRCWVEKLETPYEMTGVQVDTDSQEFKLEDFPIKGFNISTP